MPRQKETEFVLQTNETWRAFYYDDFFYLDTGKIQIVESNLESDWEKLPAKIFLVTLLDREIKIPADAYSIANSVLTIAENSMPGKAWNHLPVNTKNVKQGMMLDEDLYYNTKKVCLYDRDRINVKNYVILNSSDDLIQMGGGETEIWHSGI